MPPSSSSGSRSSNLTDKFEEERIRTQEQSQIVYLQGQIDELRRLIKDQTNKYQWAIEQSRKTDAAVAQVQSAFERHAEDMRLLAERAKRDVVDIRKEFSGVSVRMQENVEVIRQMQAQIQQLAESRKQDRDESFAWVARVEAVEQQYNTLHAQLKESDERYRQLPSQLNQLRDADTLTLEEIQRVKEDMQVEKQSLRRQAIEAQQLVADVRGVIEEHDSRISRIDEIRENVELFAETLPGQIAEIRDKLPDFDVEIKRVERISTERFLMNQERLEELRHQADEKIMSLQETEEQHMHQHTSWLERIDSMLHELEQRIVRDVNRLDEVQRQHLSALRIIEERERQWMIALQTIVAKQFDTLQDTAFGYDAGE